MKCPIFCSLGFSVGNVIYNEKVSLTNSMGDTNSRELASPTELVRSSHSRVDELPLSDKGSKFTLFIFVTESRSQPLLVGKTTSNIGKCLS